MAGVYSVIGVLPAGFQFPPNVDLWLPADLGGEKFKQDVP